MTTFYYAKPVVKNNLTYVLISVRDDTFDPPELKTAFEINTRLRKLCGDKVTEIQEGIFEFDFTLNEVESILQKDAIINSSVLSIYLLSEYLDDMIEEEE